ncbi:TPA: DNA ligase [Streptococcus suis]|nr:DNA ligase [Streptococcus suis]HEM4925543.1 DNA ligase [Streptococcus suis]
MAKTKQIFQIIADLDQQINQLLEIKSDLESLFNDAADTQKNDSKESVITLEQVRAVLADKSRLGFTKDIKHLITEFGATKLSEVKPQDYVTLLKKAEELGND